MMKQGKPPMRFFYLSLKARIFLLNAVLLVITLIGAALMIWYTYRIEAVFRNVINRHVQVFEVAESMETALINQKGHVTYFYQDGNPEWLSRLARYEDLFDERLEQAKKMLDDPDEQKIIQDLEKEYSRYVLDRRQVAALYLSGDRDQGFSLHQQVRPMFFELIEMCEQLKGLQKEKIRTAFETSREASSRLRYMAALAIASVILLSLLINYIFARHIIGPIQKLILQVDAGKQTGKPMNEMAELKKGVIGLMEDAEETQLKLRQSQESLIKSEKMALVGKLAAGTAHSIRNPLTSIKMRLFSLNRSAVLSGAHKEDLNVISGEIMQINKIVENFLEFARPPRLVMKLMSPSSVVDSAVYLLEQRLKSYNVTLSTVRGDRLPETLVDPEQLKEVIINIIINACEAMKEGGTIIVQEAEMDDGTCRKAIVRIYDDGEGIPEPIRGSIFDPFFTTKEQGTGLGLSIAFNIIQEHGGKLDAGSAGGRGACFTITLPVKEEREDEPNTGHR